MPQRKVTLGLLVLAMAALLALLALLLNLRGMSGALPNAALDAALALNLLLLPVPPLCLAALRRGHDRAQENIAATQAAVDANTRFLTQISLEIRTPMNAIMGMTQLALQTQLTTEQRDLLTKADQASRILLGLVNDLLDVAKIEAGHMRIESLPLRLEDVVTQAVDVVRPLHCQPGVALICDWADAALLGSQGQLCGDALRLQQVLVNLLSNAIKFTSEGQVLLRLATGRPEVPDGVALLITVQDSGIGMSSEQMAGLFRAFGHGDASTSQRHGGTGLGLTVTQRLVELMGGTLDVQSSPGRGSRFEIRLTLAKDSAATPPALLSPRRLLLAEARSDSRAATQALLAHLGLGDGVATSVDVASTLGALDVARHGGRSFDWLLLDWQLPGPGPTGADLLARLRRDHPGLRIAVLNPPGLDDGSSQARAFGARALCPQPLLPGELRRLLNDAPGERPLAVDGQSLAQLRVLLVEDHPVNQEIALRLLSSRGAKVDVAGNGQEGMDKLLARGPGAYDLVLMDLQMPVLDGLSATRRLRALPGFETLPVLAMTAHALAEERAQCLAAGMQGHIAKPLDVARLVRELQRYRPPPQVAAAPVLDMATGLRQFDGQAALYRRTMQGFAAQYTEGLSGWATWLAAGEWTELRRAAHTLQGLAATLGAQPLHRMALALERSAVAANTDAAGGQIDRVEAGLAELLAEIRQVLAQPAATPPQQGPGDLAELHQLLGQSDSRALDWWQAHGAHSGLDATTAGRLEQALAALDFDAAMQALKDSA